MMLFGT